MTDPPTIRELPLLVEGDGPPLPARVYCPAETVTCVLVFCAPFFDERKSAQRSLVLTARRLAAAGVASLRFDYRGCGDAAGTLSDVSLADWVADTGRAVGRARSLVPGAPVGLLGLRGGGLPACMAVAGGCEADFLVLWEPVVDGAAYMRRELQRKLIRDAVTGTEKMGRKELLRRMNDCGELDLDGYVIPASLYNDICSANGADAARGFRGPAFLLQIGPSRRPGASLQQLSESLPNATSQVLVAKPIWERMDPEVPQAVMDATAEWLEGRGAAKPLDLGHRFRLELEDAASPAALDGEGWREMRCEFASDGAAVRGVLCRPEGTDPKDRCAVIVHGWGGCRAGPHRLQVDAARRMAQAGVASLRFDLRGRGESGGEGTRATLDGMIEDSQAAIRFLQSQTGASRVGIVGICSGGNVAIGAATLCPDVDALALWSTLPFMEHHKKKARWLKGLQMARQYAHKLMDTGTWRRIVRGEINYGMSARAITGASAGDAGEKRSSRDIMAAFAGYRGRVLFGYGGNDPEGAAAREVYEPFCAAHGLRAEFHSIAGSNHNYYGAAWRDALIERTVSALLEDA